MEPKMLVTDAAGILNTTVQALHNQIKRKHLPHSKSKNRVYFGHETAKRIFEFNFDKQVISFQIVKGGTGKTSLCLGFGIRASLYGARVLLIDLDQQGNLSKACGAKATESPVMIELIDQELDITDGIMPVCDGLDILPSRIENALLDSSLMLRRLPLDHVYNDMIVPLKDKYDLILIDCPPALGCSVTAAALASDKIISPVTPSEFSLEGLEITSREIATVGNKYHKVIPVFPILNEFNPVTSLSNDTLRFLISHPTYSKNLIRSVIRRSQEFENILQKKVSIFDSLATSTAKEDVDLMTKELLCLGEFKIKEDFQPVDMSRINAISA